MCVLDRERERERGRERAIERERERERENVRPVYIGMTKHLNNNKNTLMMFVENDHKRLERTLISGLHPEPWMQTADISSLKGLLQSFQNLL